MIWFVFSQNYPAFWLENELTVMGMVVVEYESRGLGRAEFEQSPGKRQR